MYNLGQKDMTGKNMESTESVTKQNKVCKHDNLSF